MMGLNGIEYSILFRSGLSGQLQGHMASTSLPGRDEEMRKEARKGHHVLYVQPLGQKPR